MVVVVVVVEVVVVVVVVVVDVVVIVVVVVVVPYTKQTTIQVRLHVELTGFTRKYLVTKQPGPRA